MSNTDPQIDFIASMLPDFSRSLIQKAYLQANKNADLAVDMLLSGSVKDTEPAKPMNAPPKQTEKKLTPEEEDELFAKMLAEQLEMEDNSKHDLDAEYARSLMAAESDEAMARRLQNEMNASSYRGFGNTPYGVHDNYAFDDSTVSFDLKQLDEGIVNEMLAQLKDKIIPMITEEIQKVNVPPIDEKVDTGKAGAVAFGVKGLGMEKVEVPKDKLTLKLDGLKLQLHVTDISAKMKEFDWYYEKDTFPKLKDDGKGNAGVRNCSIHVVMGIGLAGNNPSIQIATCQVNIGDLDLKISGTKASFIYNLLVSAFKSTIKKAIEKELTDMVTDALSGNLTNMLQNLE